MKKQTLAFLFLTMIVTMQTQCGLYKIDNIFAPPMPLSKDTNSISVYVETHSILTAAGENLEVIAVSDILKAIKDQSDKRFDLITALGLKNTNGGSLPLANDGAITTKQLENVSGIYSFAQPVNITK